MDHANRRFTISLLLALAALCSVARAEVFDWRDAYGLNLVSPVRSQIGGTCWAHAAVGALEAKYMITRNDPTFSPDCSEQMLVCAGIGTVNGGWSRDAISFCASIGLVSEAELPLTGQNTSPNWPLQSGWQSRLWKSTSRYSIANDVATMKTALKQNGPFAVSIMTSTPWYSPTSGSINTHAMLAVGFHDDENAPGGGYWTIKNSWGSAWNGDGYCQISYEAFLAGGSACSCDGLNGLAYYTGAMTTANWQNATAAESNIWAAGDNANWTSEGSAHTWVNQETAAVFDANVNNQIAINGTVIAHGLTFNTGATGYVFSGGSMTVTGGGIVANESVTINAPVTVGAPQTWTTAAGNTLNIGGDVHTIISTLTVGGDGDTYVGGAIDGGGAVNAAGASAGNLIKNGSGVLTIAGASNYDSSMAINAGTLSLSPQSPGSVATYGGDISGAGSLVVGSGAVVLGGQNTYIGDTTVTAGTLTLSAAGSMLMDVNDPSEPYTQFLGDGWLNLDGLLSLDLYDITLESASWTLVEDSLDASYGSTFALYAINGGAFSELNDIFSYVDALDRLWTFTESTGVLTLGAVPEPGVLALLIPGLAGLLAYAWRKRG